ncbi:transposase [Geoalkalibacter halelectricus]|uniref:transposase n=1 Tax=Geoalkalibacter halelectricus TaxID=2847045 RepID=UPI0026706C58|nr:transposase [Geoalkalibacter halelectricus]
MATVIRSFKSAVTKRINALRDASGCPVWQRNYYEHVIRGERDLHAIRQYIADNPAQWEMDTNHPNRI